MSTWGLANTAPLSDFGTNEIADRLYDYIRTKWTLTGDLAQAKLPTINRPNPGKAGYWLNIVQAGGESGRGYTGSFVQPTLTRQGLIPFKITLMIRFFSKRPTQGLTFPQLDQMVQETQRIIYQYYTDPTMPWIVEMDYFRWGPVIEASRDMGREFNNIYRVDGSIDIHTAKVSTA